MPRDTKTTSPFRERKRLLAPRPGGRGRGRPWAWVSGGVAFVFAVAALVVGTGEFGDDASTNDFDYTASAEANGVWVDGSEIHMGQVPLNETVAPTWTIENTSGSTVRLGEPHATVVEGCCPGQFLLEDATLEPGETTQLVFPLQMHAGMDGPHDFDIHLPVGDGEDEYLTLGVKGDFGG